MHLLQLSHFFASVDDNLVPLLPTHFRILYGRARPLRSQVKRATEKQVRACHSLSPDGSGGMENPCSAANRSAVARSASTCRNESGGTLPFFAVAVVHIDTYAPEQDLLMAGSYVSSPWDKAEPRKPPGGRLHSAGRRVGQAALSRQTVRVYQSTAGSHFARAVDQRLMPGVEFPGSAASKARSSGRPVCFPRTCERVRRQSLGNVARSHTKQPQSLERWLSRLLADYRERAARVRRVLVSAR